MSRNHSVAAILEKLFLDDLIQNISKPGGAHSPTEFLYHALATIFPHSSSGLRVVQEAFDSLSDTLWVAGFNEQAGLPI